MFQLVNVHGDPINDETFATYEEAEARARQEWADGWEIYVAPVVTTDNEER